jgi:hypothetical protein
MQSLAATARRLGQAPVQRGWGAGGRVIYQRPGSAPGLFLLGTPDPAAQLEAVHAEWKRLAPEPP